MAVIPGLVSPQMLRNAVGRLPRGAGAGAERLLAGASPERRAGLLVGAIFLAVVAAAIYLLRTEKLKRDIYL